MENWGCGTVLSPVTKINYEIMHEFEANSRPVEDTRYTFKSYVRGRVVSFTWDAISSYIGDPLQLPLGGKCEYSRKEASRTWNIEEIESVLSFENRWFTLNHVGFPTRMDRGNMNQKAHLYLILLLHNIKSRSHNSDLTVDMSCPLYWIMSGEEVDVAQSISQEIR